MKGYVDKEKKWEITEVVPLGKVAEKHEGVSIYLTEEKKIFLQAELRKANEYAAQMKRDAQLKKEHAERKQK